MRLLVVLLIGSSLAGCASSDGDDVAGPAGTLAFEPAERLPGDQVGAEPNFAHGPEGQLWVVAPGSVIESPNVHRSEVSIWASADHGATWEAIRTPAARDESGTWCSCDADIDLGVDGTLYLTDFWVTPGPAGFVVEASTDGGLTWGPGNFLTQTNLVANDRQYITAGDEAGEVYLTYARGTLAPAVGPLVQPDAGFHVLRSTDGGITFVERPQPYRPADGGFAFIGKMRQGPNGALFFPWAEIGPGGDTWSNPATPVVATSHDDGFSWQRVEVGDIPNGVGGLWPMAADVGPDNVVHVVWMERRPGGGSVLWYASSHDGGSSYAEPRIVGWPNGTATLPWIAHAGPGRAVVAFYGNPEAIEPLDAPEGTQWHAWALAVGPGLDDTPVAVAPFPVKVGRFCPQGASCAEDRELLDYPAIVWRDGWVNVAFAVSILDEGAGPERDDGPRGGHSTAAHVWVARAPLP